MSTLEQELVQLITREARLLDESRYDEWLALYTSDCTFWMPAWREDGTLTEDPERELSMIYYRGRRNLEDRIKRIRSGHSVASRVMPRVIHLVTNVIVEDQDAAKPFASASFNINAYDPRTNRSHTFFGRYRHDFEHEGDDWKIAGKTIYLMNEVIPTMLDIYSI